MGGIHRNSINFSLVAGMVLLLAGIVRMPGGDHMRAMTRLTTETIMIGGLAVYIFICVNRWVALFVVLVTLTAMFPLFDRFAHWRRSAVLFGAVWYAFVYLCVGDPKWIFNAVCIISIVNVIAIALQANGLDPYRVFSFGLFKSSVSQIMSTDQVGFQFNINETSALLGLSFPLFFREHWKKFIPLIVMGLIATKSTVGVAAVIGGCVVYLIRQRKYHYIWCALAALPAYTFLWDKGLTESVLFRWKYIKLAVKIASENLFGVGPGHWHIATNQLHAHNDIFQMIAEAGFLALVLIAGYLATLYRRIDTYQCVILAGIVIVSMSSFMWFIPTTAIVMVSLLAVIDRHEKSFA